MVAVFNVHARIDQSSSSSNRRNGQNVQHLHFVAFFYHPHVTAIADAASTTSLMRNPLAEVRQILSAALGSASESPAIIEEV
jgi:hypothetical protein